MSLGNRARSWWEDPTFDLRALTGGQRYTAVALVVYAFALLTFGTPDGKVGASPVYAGDIPLRAQQARLTPSATAPDGRPPSPLDVAGMSPQPDVDTTSAETATTTTVASEEPAPESPAPAEPTTTTTQPPPSPALLPVPLPVAPSIPGQ